MARFWNDLKYHEDKVVKRKLNRDDVEFLKELQTELNTQDTCCTANPRYWVIMDERFVTCSEGEMDTFQVYDSEQVEVVATGMKEFFEYLVELIHEDILPDDLNVILGRDCIAATLRGDEYCMESLFDLTSFCEEIESIAHLQFFPVREETFARENEMFLTQIDAEKHLRANHYHYGEKARTFCMSSWRSPRYEKLLQILSEVDFEEDENG